MAGLAYGFKTPHSVKATTTAPLALSGCERSIEKGRATKGADVSYQADEHSRTASGAPRGFGTRDIVAGLLMISIAGIGYAASLGYLNNPALDFGRLSAIGPGLLPRVTAVLLAALGAIIVIEGLTVNSSKLDAWELRGIVFVLGAILAFAATVRPLGLAVAGPLAVMIAGLADRSTRFVEILPFALAISLFSIGLFRFALGLPIPVQPALLGY